MISTKRLNDSTNELMIEIRMMEEMISTKRFNDSTNDEGVHSRSIGCLAGMEGGKQWAETREERCTLPLPPCGLGTAWEAAMRYICVNVLLLLDRARS